MPRCSLKLDSWVTGWMSVVWCYSAVPAVISVEFLTLRDCCEDAEKY